MQAQLEPLSKLVSLPRNPKLHNLGDIHQSIDRFGFVLRIVINNQTNHIIAGEGRVITLRQKKLANEKPPEGVIAKPDDWYVPTDRIDVPESEEIALAIALNRIGENEWDEALTARLLSDLSAENNLEGTGFDGDQVDYLLKKTAPQKSFEETDDETLAKYLEEKSNWKWLRLRVTVDVYERWFDLRKQLNRFENDDAFMEFMLNLLSEELIEHL